MDWSLKHKQSGFTLIELVVVIVILGILAATALPKFIDLKSSAEIAGAAGVAGGITSASAINYATSKVSGVSVSPSTLNGDSSTLCSTSTLGSLLSSGWPANYTVAATSAGQTCTAGGNNSCTVTTGGGTAIAVITCY